MTKEIWLNFPAKNLGKTKNFYAKIGFRLNEKHTNETMVCFEVGTNKTTVLFFAENVFKNLAKNEILNTKNGSEILISFDAANREEVDDTARRVFEAGGTIFSEPQEIQGWMYGFAFADLDGHRWNQVFMDYSKISQSE